MVIRIVDGIAIVGIVVVTISIIAGVVLGSGVLSGVGSILSFRFFTIVSIATAVV